MKTIDILITSDGRALWLKEGTKLPESPPGEQSYHSVEEYKFLHVKYTAAVAALEKEGVLIEDSFETKDVLNNAGIEFTWNQGNPLPKPGIYRGVKVPEHHEVWQWSKGSEDWCDGFPPDGVMNTTTRQVLRFPSDSEPDTRLKTGELIRGEGSNSEGEPKTVGKTMLHDDSGRPLREIPIRLVGDPAVKRELNCMHKKDDRFCKYPDCVGYECKVSEQSPETQEQLIDELIEMYESHRTLGGFRHTREAKEKVQKQFTITRRS